MKTPCYIKRGDKIGIVSTARRISKEEIYPAVKIFKEWGLKVVLGKHLFEEYDQFAGTDEQRTADLQQMLNENSVKAIICARGGYGTVRIIDKLNFSRFIKNPKWIAGYSDVTVLHSHIHSNFGIETLHSTMPLNIFENKFTEESLESFRKALFGEKITYSLKCSSLSRKGKAEGILVGGNLSILYSLIGTKSDINTNGKILFIEDLDEYLYHIDRMMMNLKRAGKLNNLAGLIVGGMSEMNDNKIPFGKTANKIIAETIEEYNYPVCFDFPAGHKNDNRVLILGREIKFNVEKKVEVKF
ncbi:MAG: LD-carboxypeptidase [Bacteroidales bacterium]|nr:LD-carboxypeptidase [Bacteroidales bacterium]